MIPGGAEQEPIGPPLADLVRSISSDKDRGLHAGVGIAVGLNLVQEPPTVFGIHGIEVETARIRIKVESSIWTSRKSSP